MLHMGIRGTRIAAAWGGVGVASRDPRNVRHALCSPIGPHWAWQVTGSHLGGRSTRLPDPRSYCFCCCCHKEPHHLPWLLQTQSLLTQGFNCPTASMAWQQWCADFQSFLWFCSYLLSQKMFTSPALIGSLTLSLSSTRHTERYPKAYGLPSSCALSFPWVTNVQCKANVSCICS